MFQQVDQRRALTRVIATIPLRWNAFNPFVPTVAFSQHFLSERLTSRGIRGAQLRAPLKPLVHHGTDVIHDDLNAAAERKYKKIRVRKYICIYLSSILYIFYFEDYKRKHKKIRVGNFFFYYNAFLFNSI